MGHVAHTLPRPARAISHPCRTPEHTVILHDSGTITGFMSTACPPRPASGAHWAPQRQWEPGRFLASRICRIRGSGLLPGCRDPARTPQNWGFRKEQLVFWYFWSSVAGNGPAKHYTPSGPGSKPPVDFQLGWLLGWRDLGEIWLGAHHFRILRCGPTGNSENRRNSTIFGPKS